MIKPTEVVLWHDKNIVLTIENCDVTLCVDSTDVTLPYRWLELETGQQFAELDGWHFIIKYGKGQVTGWENYYEEAY